MGIVAYRLALPPSLLGVHEVFHVSMLRKYTPDPAHVVEWGGIVGYTNGTFKEGLVRIMDSRDQVLRRKTVKLVKVLWQNRGVEEATWEREDTMRDTYLFLFKDEGTFFKGTGNRMTIAYARDSMCMCVEFRDKILLRGEEYKTQEKFKFSEKG